MRIGLLTESGYPYVTGEARLWCDRLVRGLEVYEFDIFALSRSAHQEDQGWVELPPQVHRVRTAPLWTAEGEPGELSRRGRKRFRTHFADLAAAVCGDGERQADRFSSALRGLVELARDEGPLTGALRSESAVRELERACRAPGARRAAHHARVPDLLAVADLIERTLRPLSLDWYEEVEGGLGAVDLCHATSGGSAALPGLVAKQLHGVPLLVTEYGVQLRAHYLGADTEALSAPARSLLAAFQGRLAAEVYREAEVITPGNTHVRRWQEKCGADRDKLRTVYPGMADERFAVVGEFATLGEEAAADAGTLVWVGRIEPAKDLVGLLHAFAEVRKEAPGTRLRLIGTPAEGDEAAAYLAQCRALAAQLFPDEAEGAHAVGDNPVSFEEIGGPEIPELADAYAAGDVVVMSSVVEGFPVGLVEAMLCGRATVSTDVGAVVEAIGGTGLVVPPRNPRALADACLALLGDPTRRWRLGAAARARALELFTVEQNIAAFHSIYLEIVSHCPVHREAYDADGEPLLFAHPAETHVPGRPTAAGAGGRWLAAAGGGRSEGPSWADADAEAAVDGPSDAQQEPALVISAAVAHGAPADREQALAVGSGPAPGEPER
ncbi:DUF3492 domain-containing protein [Streptomyces triticagri]|uniref:D-inositol 3-phosphate glycosyltransferase n=1 Tax=Streptomyces triticagri TaxID=2293568 RepID=A0A372M1V5_9ACTN|nr:DUF3492 domain-containing protein [Streptomyces triticagri]RFU84924.1 DUF3492 domain-containing protein [Streptomyces triticagri]